MLTTLKENKIIIAFSLLFPLNSLERKFCEEENRERESFWNEITSLGGNLELVKFVSFNQAKGSEDDIKTKAKWTKEHFKEELKNKGREKRAKKKPESPF